MTNPQKKNATQSESGKTTSLILFIVILLCGSLVLLCLLLGVLEKNKIRQAAVEELARYGDSLVGQQLQSIRLVLDDLAKNTDIIALASSEEEQSLVVEKYLTGVADGSGASIVYILDPQGTVIGCSRYGGGKTLIGKNYGFREYFQGAIKGRHIVFPAVGITTKKRGLYFSAPVYAAPGRDKIIAAAVVKMGVERIEKVIQSMDYPSGMVTPSGVIFASNSLSMLFHRTKGIDAQELERLIASRQFGDSKLDLHSYARETTTGGGVFLQERIKERKELLFPGWYLTQWREFRYPTELAFMYSLVTVVIFCFTGLLIVGRRKRLQKDRELQIAKERAEEYLRKGYETLQHILKSSPVSVCVCDQSHQITWLNKTALQMLGVTEYNQAKQFRFGEELNIVNDENVSLLNNNAKVKITNLEGILQTTEDNEIPVLFNRTSFLRDDKELYLYFFLDLSERKQMEAELVHTRKMESIGQLAAGIAHEINSPAQFVGSNIDFILESLPDLFSVVDGYETILGTIESGDENLKEVKTGLDQIKETADYDYLREELPIATKQSREGVERISKIVLAMKAFSHPGDSNTMLPADINNALETTLTVAANEWKSIADVQLELASELPAVDCLIGELNQVFLNLIVNGAHAIEARQRGEETFKKGLLKIATALDDDYATISISDNGTGIPTEHAEKIFDPFFTTKDVGKGSGQGLYIARTLIHDQHDGTLSFETTYGEGTTFTIRLPLRHKQDAVS